MVDDPEYFVVFTHPVDGTRLDPIYTIESYGTQYIAQDDAGPTIRAAWEAWLSELQGKSEGN